MADISVHDNALHIELTVAERLLALHGRDVEIPLSAITAARAVPDVLAYKRGVKMAGAGIPGTVMVGTWRGLDGGSPYADFAVVHHGGSGVIVEADDADYDRVLIGTTEPDELIAELGR
jgi:hypothetical protein